MFAIMHRTPERVKQALRSVHELVPDDMLKMAVDWARVAAEKFTDYAHRRAFVAQMLMARGTPESVARLATELAVQLLKQELRATTTS